MKFKKIFSFICGSVIGLAICTSQANADIKSPKRLWGMNRYETCTEISSNGWNKECDYAILATGDDYPDALSAAPLAKKYNAPIFLVSKNELDNTSNSSAKTVRNELKRLGVKKVFIIGGKSVISEKVENQLTLCNIQYQRLAGSDRFETALLVAKQIGTSNGVIVTTGFDFTDALSVSSAAALKQMPILLVSKTDVSSNVKSFVTENSTPISYILGGDDIISNNVANAFPKAERILGNDIFERNINIINKFSDVLNPNTLFVATASDYADALSGSVMASMNSSPIILTNENISSFTNNYISSTGKKVNNIYFLGGEAVIKPSVVEKMQTTLINNKGLTVESIE